MKRQSISLFTTFSKSNTEIFNSPNHEIGSLNLAETSGKKFTPAELWNIQRHGKGRIQERYL